MFNYKKIIIQFSLLCLVLLSACGGSQSNNDPTLDFDSSVREETILQQYFRENKISPLKHSTGFYYLIPTSTADIKANKGDTLNVFFKGNALYGKAFVDSSRVRYPNDAITFRLNVFTNFPTFRNKQAFHDATALLSKGDKGTFFFPSRLMYGKGGLLGGLILPNTPLVYELELQNIRRQ